MPDSRRLPKKNTQMRQPTLQAKKMRGWVLMMPRAVGFLGVGGWPQLEPDRAGAVTDAALCRSLPRLARQET